jgi:hypothetical protein
MTTWEYCEVGYLDVRAEHSKSLSERYPNAGPIVVVMTYDGGLFNQEIMDEVNHALPVSGVPNKGVRDAVAILGKQGWEVISVSHQGGYFRQFVLKRSVE